MKKITSVERKSMEAVSQKCLHEDVGKIYIFSLSSPITGIMLLNEKHQARSFDKRNTGCVWATSLFLKKFNKTSKERKREYYSIVEN